MSADLGLMPPETRDGVVGIDKELTLRCAGDPAMEDGQWSGLQSDMATWQGEIDCCLVERCRQWNCCVMNHHRGLQLRALEHLEHRQGVLDTPQGRRGGRLELQQLLVVTRRGYF